MSSGQDKLAASQEQLRMDISKSQKWFKHKISAIRADQSESKEETHQTNTWGGGGGDTAVINLQAHDLCEFHSEILM
jgi:hypothetical protein